MSKYIDALLGMRAEYEQLRQSLEVKISKIDELIALERMDQVNSTDIPFLPDFAKIPASTINKVSIRTILQKEYNQKMNFREKIVHVIHDARKPISAADIAAEIKRREPATTLSVDKSVQLNTSRMKRDEILGSQKDGKKSLYYLRD